MQCDLLVTVVVLLLTLWSWDLLWSLVMATVLVVGHGYCFGHCHVFDYLHYAGILSLTFLHVI